MVSACEACGQENPREARFCMRCGAAVSPEGSVEEARKVVSVLFCDLVGSTTATERLDPEDVSFVLRGYHRSARSIIERYGGTVEKFVGDGVFAVFGVPTVREDDPERAVRAALDICSAAAELPGFEGDRVHLRCAVTTGEALVQVRVDPTSGEGFLTGDAANLVGRLQSLAPADACVVDEPTYERTREVFSYDVLGLASVKGKASEVATFRPRQALVLMGSELRNALRSPLVGRSTELAELVTAFGDAVAEERPTFLTITGEPGLGKSRLVAALHERVAAGEAAPVWLVGRCLPYGDGVGFFALSEILKSHTGVLETDDGATTLARLDAVLPPGPYRDWMRQRLLPLLGVDAPVQADREELFAAWQRFLEGLAAERPAIVVFEDVHWADEALLSFLAQLVESTGSARLLVIATARPELLERGRDPRIAAITRRSVHLAPLSDVDTASLVHHLLEGAALSSEIEETILLHAGGNALYAGEFVRLLLEGGVLVDDHGVWRLGEGERLPVPESMHALIAARLDTLPTEQRGLLGDAAVIGGTFWAGALATVGRRPFPDVLDALESLGRRHLVAFAPESSLAGEIELSFSHVLVRDAAYAQLTRRARAEKHHAVARWIEQTSGDRTGDVAEILAHHACTALDLWPAEDAAEVEELRAAALRHSTTAAVRNVAINTPAAARHLERALALSTDRDHGHTELAALAGQIALQEGRFEEAAERLEQAISVFKEHGDVRAASRTMVPLAYVYESLGSARGLALADEAVELLEGGPSCVELLDALSLAVATRTIGGDPRAGIDASERAFAVAGELGIERPTLALGYRGLARFYLGDMDGLDDVREAAELGAARGEGRDAGLTFHNLIMFEHVARGPAAALDARGRAAGFARERGLTEMWTLARMGGLDSMLDLGDLDDALLIATELEEQAEALSSGYILLYTRAWLLRAWAHRGELQRVEAAAAWLEPAARETGAPEDLVAGIAACATGLCADGHHEASLALIEELVAVDAGSVWILAPRLPGLARAAALAGDADLLERLIASATHPSPYAHASVAAARAVHAELVDGPSVAAQAYAAAADSFAHLGVPIEQWIALCGMERMLAATGDADGARHAGAAAEHVRASMPSGASLEPSPALR